MATERQAWARGRGRRRDLAGPSITAAEAHFVEEMGLFYEQVGITRMAGRIIGWLMICDPPHQTLRQLEEALQASKGSISTMTRLLTQLGMLKRTSIPGDRRDYVSIPPGAFQQLMAQQSERVTVVRRLAEMGLEAIKGARPERLVRLREMRDLYAFLEREMPLLIERWIKDSKQAAGQKYRAGT